MAFTLDPQTGKITFGVVADLTNDAISRDIASEFGVSETFNDDFSSNLGWTLTGTGVAITGGVLDYPYQGDGTTQGASFDLGAGVVSDTSWVMRFKLVINDISGTPASDAISVAYGIADIQTQSANTAVDGLHFSINKSNLLGDEFYLLNTNSALPQQGSATNIQAFTTPPVAGTYFIELKRESATVGRATIFSDASYTVVTETQTITTSASVISLRFINFTGRVLNRTGVIETEVDDLQFWDGITVPVITSNNWRMRFELDITNLTNPSTSDISMWIGLSDSDATVGAGGVQDAFLLALFHDSVASTFHQNTPDNSAPRLTGADNTLPTSPSVTTFFIEMRRDSASQSRIIFYTDNTFTTVLTSTGSAGISGTDNLKYLKLINDEGANVASSAIDGTFDNFTFTSLVGATTINKVFTVNAILLQIQFPCGTKVIFQDDFSTNTNWVQTGTQVTITGGEIQGWGPDATNQRLTHDLVTPLSDKGWTAEFEFEFSAFANPAHDIFVLTDTNSTSSALQDHIVCRFGFSGGLIQFGILNGGNSQIGSGAIIPVTASINTRYFVRLQRITLGLARLTVFTGGFDSVLFGTIDVDLTLFGGPPVGLRFAQSQTSDLGGGARTLTGIIDNLVITNACCNFNVDALLQTQGGSCESLLTFTDDFNPDIGWVTTDATNMFISGSQVLIARAFPDNTNDTIALDLDTPARLNGKISDNNFQIRFKLSWGQIGAGNPGNTMFFGASDKDQTINMGQDVEDLIGLRGRVGSGADTAIGIFKDNSGALSGATPTLHTISTGLIRFYEIIRAGTTVTWNVYTDSGYTNLIASESLTVPTSVNSLQFFKVGNNRFANILTTIEADLDDLDIISGGGTGNVACIAVDALLQAQGDSGLCGVQSFSQLKAYYSFNEASGTFFNTATALGSVDSLGSNSNLTDLVDLTNGATGQVGDAVDFGSFNGFAKSTNRFNFMHQTSPIWTWNAWLKVDFQIGLVGLFSSISTAGSNTGVQIALFGSTSPNRLNPNLRIRNGGGGGTAGDVIAGATDTSIDLVGLTGQYVMLTLTYDHTLSSDNLTFYLNGQKGGTFTKSGNTPSTGNANRAGQFGNIDFGSFFNYTGDLDEASIWNRVLTSTEITGMFSLGNAGLPLEITSGGVSCFSVDALLQALGDNGACVPVILQAYYTFTQTTGNLLADSLGNIVGADSTSITNIDQSNTGRIGNGYRSATAGGASILIGGTANDWNFLGRGDWTANFWINSDEIGGFNSIIFSTATLPTKEGVEILYNSNNAPQLKMAVNIFDDNVAVFGGGSLTGYVIKNDQTWHMYTIVVREGVGIEFYRDGVLFSTSVNTNTFNIESSDTTPEFFGTGVEDVPDTNYDEWSFWEGALISSEILQLYNSGSGLTITQPFLDGLVRDQRSCIEVDARIITQPTKDFFVDALIKRFGDVLCAGGQGIFFQEDFTTNTGWTNNDTVRIRIDDITFPNVMRIVNLHPTTQGLKRAVKALPIPFTPSNDFIWEFKHIHFAGGTSSASEWKIELKETSADAGAGSSATETTIRYRTDVVPTSGPERLRLEVFDKNGINGVLSLPESQIILQDNFTYFPRITKTGTIVKLELFTDANRTTQETGSPVQVDTTGFDMSQNLGFIYTGNFSTGGPARLANEEIDDIIILNSICPRFQVSASLKATQTKTFLVDGFIFILPVVNTFVNALLKASNQEKDFTIDGCLRIETREEFEIDACLQIEDRDELFLVDALIFILPVRLFLVDAIVRYAQGTTLLGGIPDLIIRVLRENPPSLTGLQIVDEIVKITSDPAEGFSFRGKTSRIKNWLNRLRLDGFIIDDNSNPDWYRTNWSLDPAVFP